MLAAAIHLKDSKKCKAVEINIVGVENNFFVDKEDILNTIKNIAGENPVGKAIGSFNLKLTEAALSKNTWVKSAQLFFDNNNTLQVKINEREPIARVFTKMGTSFYLDDHVNMLPLSEKFSARLPIFTNFPSDKKVLSAVDSNLLNDIKIMSIAIQKDSFRMAMIEQIDITPQYNFEMIPKIGTQTILFGNATDVDLKFNKLQLFYKEVMQYAGWNKYSTINLQYKNQVVAKRKDMEDVFADSLRTQQLMQIIVANAERHSNDSLQTIQQDNNFNSVDSSLVQQSLERDDDGGGVDDSAKVSVIKKIKTPIINHQSLNPKPVHVIKKTASVPQKMAVPIKKVSPKPLAPKHLLAKPLQPIVKKVTPKKPPPKPKPVVKKTNEY